MKILALTSIMMLGAKACWNIPETPYDVLVSFKLDGTPRKALKVDPTANLTLFRSCLYYGGLGLPNNTQFFVNGSQPIQSIDEQYASVGSIIQNNTENANVVNAWTAPYVRLVFTDSQTSDMYVQLFDSFTLRQLRVSSQLDSSIQFAYGGSPIDVNDEWSILISDAEEQGAVYTYSSGNHTNTTLYESDFENIQNAGKINITNATLDSFYNPNDTSYDLGKFGYFSNFTILVGIFDGSGSDTDPRQSWLEEVYKSNLYQLGFNFVFSYNEYNYVNLLTRDDVVETHIISGNSFINPGMYDWWFGSALLKFQQSGKGVLIWGNDQSFLNYHSNIFLQYLSAGTTYYGSRIQFQFNGTHRGNTTLRPQENYWTVNQREFGSHKITTGLNRFYEGFNITAITTNVTFQEEWDKWGDFQVVANSSNTHPLLLAMNRTSEGRVVIDAGLSRLSYYNIQSNNTGNARLFRNEVVYLAFNDQSVFNSTIQADYDSQEELNEEARFLSY